MKILITGASGYIGSQLVDSWVNDGNVEKIIALDINPPKFLFKRDDLKINFIQKNLAGVNLGEELNKFGVIDVIVHAAYLIRTPYFKKARKYHEWSNFKGAENVFEFAIKNNIKKLIHFGTVASYGALAGNDLSKQIKEGDPLGEEAIAYGRDKKKIEEKLSELMGKYKSGTEVVVLRVGSVSGPFLQNTVKKTGLLKFFRGGFPFLPITGIKSARQYVHEDDVVSAVNFWINRSANAPQVALNLASENPMTFEEIAEVLRKKPIKIPYSLAKAAFALLWHLSLGKIPTPPGTINSYSYPIIVDGSKICSYGFKYKYTCREALLAVHGKFSARV